MRRRTKHLLLPLATLAFAVAAHEFLLAQGATIEEKPSVQVDPNNPNNPANKAMKRVSPAGTAGQDSKGIIIINSNDPATKGMKRGTPAGMKEKPGQGVAIDSFATKNPQAGKPGGVGNFGNLSEEPATKGGGGGKGGGGKGAVGFHEVDKPAAKNKEPVGFNPQPDPLLGRGIIDPNQALGFPGSQSPGTGRAGPIPR
ncbi:MAG TPA: hypothetical protein VH765_09805 [Xanthobacteraceae bacterium]|jgi:hypothetical protein